MVLSDCVDKNCVDVFDVRRVDTYAVAEDKKRDEIAKVLRENRLSDNVEIVCAETYFMSAIAPFVDPVEIEFI